MVWWLPPGEGWDALTITSVGITCKKGATTENQGAGGKSMG